LPNQANEKTNKIYNFAKLFTKMAHRKTGNELQLKMLCGGKCTIQRQIPKGFVGSTSDKIID
jgi:hypothetical protein